MATAFDYKKEYKDLYQPKTEPSLITVPPMSFVAVDGTGNPNRENGDFANAMQLLYSISYTIKMSHMSGQTPQGYFAYVVPPLEGLWWMQGGAPGVDYEHKENFCWTVMIRLPEFAGKEVFQWAKAEAAAKKGIDTKAAYFLQMEEGLCCQCMHLGPYDDEPATMARMEAFVAGQGLRTDHSDTRRHHELYLGDPRKTAPEKLRTVLRIPVTRL